VRWFSQLATTAYDTSRCCPASADQSERKTLLTISLPNEISRLPLASARADWAPVTHTRGLPPPSEVIDRTLFQGPLMYGWAARDACIALDALVEARAEKRLDNMDAATSVIDFAPVPTRGSGVSARPTVEERVPGLADYDTSTMGRLSAAPDLRAFDRPFALTQPETKSMVHDVAALDRVAIIGLHAFNQSPPMPWLDKKFPRVLTKDVPAWYSNPYSMGTSSTGTRRPSITETDLTAPPECESGISAVSPRVRVPWTHPGTDFPDIRQSSGGT
jgi:hypothetical protein